MRKQEALCWQREWTEEGIPILRAGAELPEEPEGTRMRRFYQMQSRCYLRYCERDLLPRARAECRAALARSVEPLCFTAELSYRETFRGGRWRSLYTQSREVTDGPFLHRWGDVWDLESGFPAPLSAFFPPRIGWKKQVLHTVREEMLRREAAGLARYLPDWRHALGRTFSSRRFYLTPEGVVVFWPMYAIAPPREGIPVFLAAPLPEDAAASSEQDL